MSNDSQTHATGNAPDADGTWENTLQELAEIRKLEERITRLKRRLVTGSHHAGATEAATITQLLLVRLGTRLVGLPMQHVEEVVRMVSLTPTDSAVAAVLGLADVHGRPVAVIDPRGLLDETIPPVAASHALVICQLPRLQVGFRVDEVVDVTPIQASDIATAEEVLPGGLRSAGVARTDNGAALVLEPLMLAVAAEIIGQLNSAGRGQ